VQRLDVVGGWWFSLYDGHGGWQAAQFAAKNLHHFLAIELGNRLGVGHEENDMLGSPDESPGGVFEGMVKERMVVGALTQAFERTDRQYLSRVSGAFEVGFGRDTRAGACAIGALLVDGTLYVANLGDSRAVLGVAKDAFASLPASERRDPHFAGEATEFLRRAAKVKSLERVDAHQSAMLDAPAPSGFLAVELSRDHNCREERERAKLVEAHPDEPDVVVCRRPDACYIKGKLQPTRSFGDFYLKYSEFMRSQNAHASAGRYIHPPYAPPYITATPEVTVTRLRPGIDEFLVLGTDGLWDFMTSQEAIDLAGQVLRGSASGDDAGTPEQACVALRKEVLSRAAARAGLQFDELEMLPQGRERRRRHDDVSIIVLDLRRANEFFWWG